MANDPIDELRRTAYPNPQRIGCPGPEVFEALKAKKIPFDDPVWEHIEHCSPCYREFADIRDALFRDERRGSIRTIVRASVAVLVLLLVGIGAFLFTRSPQTGNKQMIASTAHNGGEAAVLNFEDGSELRGASGSSQSKSPDLSTSGIQHLPRNQLSLTVYLPLGSPDGTYELEIVSPNGAVVWHVQGMASIKDGLTSLPVSGDLRGVASGEYKFRFRRLDESWHEKQVIVK